MQCNNWSELFYDNIQALICNWFFDNKNSFRIKWLQGFLPAEHNLIGIEGPAHKTLYIDPWESGGRTLINRPHNPDIFSTTNKYDGKDW